MSLKENLIAGIISVFIIFICIIGIKNIGKKKPIETRIIEQIDPDYDKKYPKSF
jgi:hypothetical protein